MDSLLLLILQVFEHQKITTKSHPQFNQSHLEALIRFNEKNQQKYFTIIQNGVKFNHHVGVIQIGQLTIEILPKADKTDNPDKNKWQTVLIQMLKTCRLLKVESLSNARLRMHRNYILDLYFELFLQEVEKLLHQGLVKQYKMTSSNRRVFKGQLQFQQHLTQNLIHKTRFYTRHLTYNFDHLFHQIIRQALRILSRIVTHPLLLGKITQLLTFFPSVTHKKITKNDFQQLTYNRKTSRYQTAIDIARLIILNHSPDIRSGGNDLIAILFDMNILFELYVFKQLKRLEQHHPIQINGQPHRKFWNKRTIRPDIVLHHEGENYILDTKWKVLKSPSPSDDDLKQMYVYGHYFNAQKSILLYPKVFDFSTYTIGQYHATTSSVYSTMQCNLLFLPIVEQNEQGAFRLSKTIGQLVLNALKD